MAEERESSLEQILTAREERAEKQSMFLKEYKTPLITFTMNIPGPVKNTEWIQKTFEIALYGLQAFCSNKLIHLEKETTAAGPQAFFTISEEISAEELKRKTVSFENRHSIGRLLDIDVRDKNGHFISREQLAMTPRKCFLCGRDAKICARSRTHSANELFLYTKNILETYLLSHK